MAVTFILGRAGSGKTERIFRKVVEAARAEPLGPPIFWIVPKQATFQTERQLTCATGGFCRVRVVSFDRLAREIMADCGDVAVPEVTEIGRQMILGHLLRQNQTRLRFFASVARRPGVAAELDATFAELERSGQTLAGLADLIDQLRHAAPRNAQGPSLVAKLQDFHLLYDAYTRYLGQERLDQHRRLQQVLERLDQCSFLRDATAYVDGFLDFTDYERRVLAGLGRTCRSVEIALLVNPDSPTVRDPHHLPEETSLFRRTEQAYRRLWFAMGEAGVVVNQPIRMDRAKRFVGNELARIERELFDSEHGDVFSLSPVRRGEGKGEGPPAESVVTQTGGHRVTPLTPALSPEYGGEGGLAMIEAADPRGEVDAAAREIQDLLRSGHRLRDVAVLVRDLNTYQGAIDISFREHGIPYFVDRRRSADHHPLVRFVRSLFQIVRGHWPHAAVMALLRSGLAGVTLAEADEIENYLIQHRLGGRAWDDPAEWAYQRQIASDADADGADALAAEPFEARHVDAMRRGVVAGVRPLLDRVRGTATSTVRELAVDVFAVFEWFEVRETISTWVRAAADAGDMEQAAEHQQVWAELVDLFEQMVDLLGDEAVSVGDFVDVLESGLDRFDLAITPPTVDQVLVGQVDRTRTPALRAAIVLGLNEGEFPRPSRDASLLSHGDRHELRRRKFELDPDSRQRLLDEGLLGYIAFTRASRRLVVTRALANDAGKPCQPSAFWNRLRGMFTAIEPTCAPRDGGDDVRNISTPRQLITVLMEWARGESSKDEGGRMKDEGRSDGGDILPPFHPSSFRPHPSLPAVYQWFASRPRQGDALDRLRARAWPALGYLNEAALSPDLARGLFPAPLSATAAQLETFAACPFKHFVRYGLRLTEREAPGVTAADMSRVYHDVLEIVVGELQEAGRDLAGITTAETDEMVRNYAGAVARRLRGELMLSSARNAYLLGRIERTLAQVIASMREALLRGQFRPARAGVRFGVGQSLPAFELRTPAGATVRVSGQIDRVDLIADGPDAGAIGAIDYKLGGGNLSLGGVRHGLSLQLLTCLLVLDAHGKQLAGRPVVPAAAFYVRLLRGLESVKHPDEAGDPASPEFLLKEKPRGLFDGRFFAALDAAAQPGQRSKVVQASLRKDGQFGYRNASDVADAHEFAALLALVRQRLGQIADDVMAGRITVAPYRMGLNTPCPRCAYRSVCRFEPMVNGYRHLGALGRQEVLDLVAGKSGAGGGEAGDAG